MPRVRSGISRDAVAVYFRAPETAHRFVARFPDLLLADGTDSVVYTPLPAVRPAPDEKSPMCNLYSMTRSQEAMRRLFAGLEDRAGNMPPLPGIYPDYPAPIIRKRRRGQGARHGALGNADAAAVPRGGGRPRRPQHPADELVALAA